MFFWMYFTKLADTNVMMPLACLLAGWLAYWHCWRAAVRWLLLFGAGLTIVVASKIAYIGWGLGIASLDFRGFSGHAMRAAAVAPVFFLLAVQSRARTITAASLLAAVAFAIAIGVSRLILHQHSLSEVIGGLALGGAIAAWVLSVERSTRSLPWNPAVATGCILIIVVGMAARPAPTERWIEKIALYLSGHDRPYPHPARRAALLPSP
jgi:membrane-associated phospholipid phosphatase